MTVPISLLKSLTYDAMLVREGGAPRVVDQAGVLARCNPPEVEGDPWLKFDFRGTAPTSARRAAGQRQGPDAGWKVHLAVDPAQIADAWDAILPVVSREPVYAKVVPPSLAAEVGEPEGTEAGKCVVIHSAGCPYADAPEFWSRMLSATETALRDARVSPGWAVLGDRPLRNSCYAHVRADKDPSGRHATGIEAFNPYGFHGPFDDVEVRTESRVPPFVGDLETRVERMLGFVAPGWEAQENGFCLLAADADDAALTDKALKGAGFRPELEGDVVTLRDLSEGDVMRRWHEAMEIRRAAEVGDLIRRAVGGDAALSLGKRRDIANPPVIRLTFGDQDCATGIHQALTRVFAAPAMTLDGLVLRIPYGGRLHVSPEDRPRYLERLSEIVTEASTRCGCRGPRP